MREHFVLRVGAEVAVDAMPGIEVDTNREFGHDANAYAREGRTYTRTQPCGLHCVWLLKRLDAKTATLMAVDVPTDESWRVEEAVLTAWVWPDGEPPQLTPAAEVAMERAAERLADMLAGVGRGQS